MDNEYQMLIDKLREALMRANVLFPESEKDLQHWNEGFKSDNAHKFLDDVADILGLGQHE